MPKLINVSTNAPEEVPLDHAEQAFLTGTHNLPAGQRVPLTDPKGNLVTVAAEEVYPSLTEGGYRFPSQGELDEAANEKEYGEGTLNVLKAFGAGALRGASAGLSDQALVRSGLVKGKTLRELEKRNPISSFAGETAGVVAPLIATGGAAAPEEAAALGAARGASELAAPTVIAKTGKAVTEGVGKALGVGEAAQGTAKKILASGAAHFAGSAVEGAAYSAGHLVSENALGDPDLTAQKAIAEVGAGALIGGGLGAILHLPGSLGAKAAPEAREVIQGVKSDLAAVRGAAPELGPEAAAGVPGGSSGAPTGTLEDALGRMDVPGEKRESVLAGLRELKPNAPDIVQAARAIDAPVLESQVSASKHVQDLDSMLMQSPTPIGVQRQQLVQKGIDQATRAVDQSLQASTNLTEVEVGNAIKQGLTEKFEAETKPVSDLYNEIKTHYEYIPVTDKSTSRIAKNIMEIEGIALSPSSPEYQLARSVADELPNLKTVDDLKAYQSILRRRTMGNPELRFVAGEIQEKLRNLEENAIVRFAESNFEEGSPYREKILGLLESREAANKSYTALREKMSEIGDVIGKRKIYGPKDFLDHISEISPEKLSEKLFAKKNSEFLQFFAKEFPVETKLLADFQKNRIREMALHDGQVQAARALREIEKFSPEVRRIVFSDSDVKRLEAAQTYLEAMPKNINPSGTSKSEAYRRFFTNPISAAVETARDAAGLKTLEKLVDTTGGQDASRLQALIRLERMAQKTTSAIAAGAKSIFRVTKEGAPGFVGSVLARPLPEDATESRAGELKRFKKRAEQIRLQAENAGVLLDTLDQATQDLHPHAPQIAGGFQRAAVNAITFLASKLPGPGDEKPLAPEWEPSAAEIATFDRSYDVVEKPVRILDQVKDGTLSLEAVEAVKTVYPELYQTMVSHVMDAMIDAHAKKTPVPYQTRLMLSLFLGEDLDSSTTSDAIAANQLTYASPSQQKDEQQAAMMGKTTQRGLEKLSVADRTLTASQRSTERDEA